MRSLLDQFRLYISFPPPATFLFFILPQFRERGNRQFFWRISYLLDIRDERSFRCRLRVVHRWTAP
ncbi:hypothetical protein GPK98_16275 [[Clostridium] symbiosum]|uniref:Uncharacterized protein n=1 Tax=Hungatella hathewayi TaxID=154046 RepID=A0A3E2U4U2_9FIRM|nr:hypothetical protein [[Clostridium] symbiosum]MBT9797959.1 hypothetical protein [Hungatella hathewayi]MBT9829171.1 hypothetical protein [Enterocloster bolteae]RGX54423.1 hypothetical protein DWV16_14260 [Anaerotruncus sp. AF02-27]MUB62919.1 hypothetical protein [Hungatella hathewayi]